MAEEAEALTREEALELENIVLKLGRNEMERHSLNQQRASVEARIADRLGHPIKGMVIDLERGTISQPPEPAGG